MLLSETQIKEITFGAVRIIPEEGGLCFYKNTQKQIDAWKQLSDIVWGISHSSTGIRFEFHTNSSHIAIEAVSGNQLEYAVNGIFRGQVKLDKLREEGKAPIADFSITDAYGKPLEDAYVTVYFPCHGPKTIIKSVTLDDGSYIKPHIFQKKILFIGDSITQGWNSKYDCHCYALRTARHFEADCVLNGVGGAFFHEDTMDSIDYDPDFVVIALGTNDLGRYKGIGEDIRPHIQKVFDFLAKEYAGKPIFALTPIWRDRIEQEESLRCFLHYGEIIAEESAKRGFYCIDGLSLVPPFPEFYADEYLHPNDNGFSIMAENLCTEIEKVLYK